MPWKTSSAMEERARFVFEYERDERTMTELCEDFGISRECGYRWLQMCIRDRPKGARVGTSSQRRRAQLKALRPDIVAQEFRGNVDTRLRKLAEGQVDAILLASAGLDRLEKTCLLYTSRCV